MCDSCLSTPNSPLYGKEPKKKDRKGKKNGGSAHLELALARGVPVGVVRLEGVVDVDVEVAPVLGVGLDLQDARDLLARLDGEHVLEVEDGLLPVGVLCVRAGGEADRLVAGREVDVEPGDEGVDEVVALDGQLEGGGEGQVGRGAGVEVEGEDGHGVGDDRLELDRVDEGF